MIVKHTTNILHCILSMERQSLNTVKPLLSGHLRDLPKCPLNRGCPPNRGCKNCAMFVNDQHSTVTLYCDKIACCLRGYPEFKFTTFHSQL